MAENHSQSTNNPPMIPSRIRQIRNMMTTTMNTRRALCHGARHRGPEICIVISLMIAKAVYAHCFMRGEDSSATWHAGHCEGTAAAIGYLDLGCYFAASLEG